MATKFTDTTLLHDAYYGTGLFWKGTGLRRHPRESEANYNERKELAYYLNYTGPIVNASVDPIFVNEIKREHTDDAMFLGFIGDVDRLGTYLQDYIRRVATLAKLYGVVYIVVNNTDKLATDRAKNIELRNYPFVTEVLPQEVTRWDFDETGKLSMFEYTAQVESSDGKVRQQRCRWTTTEWSITGEDGQVSQSGENTIGEIPIVQWFGRSTQPTVVKPPSEFISIAQANYHLYQLCSWHTQLLRDQAFSILTVPEMGSDEITVGTNNVLTYPPESSHVPAFISPDAGPANMLTDQIDRMINEMYRMSGINSVVGVEQSKSGVAKQWDFERTNQRLADFAIQCENAEKRIVSLFEKWTGVNVEYSCEYPRDFKINDISESLTQAQQALDLGFSSKTFNLEVAKKVISAYMANIEPDIYDAIVADIETSENELEQMRAAMQPAMPDGDMNEDTDNGQNN